MAHDNVALARAFYETWNGPDADSAVLAFLHPEIEWVNPDYAVEPGTRHGHRGFAGGIENLRGAFGSFEHRVEEAVGLGDRVLCHLTFRARARDGGVELEKAEQQLLTFRDVMIVRLEWFHDARAARAAAGLAE